MSRFRKCQACKGKGYSEAFVWKWQQGLAPPKRMERIPCACCGGTGKDEENGPRWFRTPRHLENDE